MQIVHGRARNVQCTDHTDILGSLRQLTTHGYPSDSTRSVSVLDDDSFTQHSGTDTKTNPPFGYPAVHIAQLSSAIFYSHYQLRLQPQLRLIYLYNRNPRNTMGDTSEAEEVTAFDDNITWDDFHNSPQAEIVLVSKDMMGFRVYAWYMKKKRSV